MSDKELESIFIRFLIEEKGYKPQNFLKEAKVNIGNSNRGYIIDLILIDTDYDDYLALIEFKAMKSDVSNLLKNSITPIKSHIEAIGKLNLPGYLVLQSENKFNFSVYLLQNNHWKELDPEDFPHFDSLSSKNNADERSYANKLSQNKAEELRKKRSLIKNTAISTIISLLIGILSIFILTKNAFFSKPRIASNDNYICCDSINNKTTLIDKRLKNIEIELLLLQENDSLLLLMENNFKLKSIENRISSIEEVFSDKPNNILKLQELTYEIKEVNSIISKQEEISEIKIQNVKDRMDQLTIWTSGLIITILGSIFGFAFNAFRQ